MRFSKPLQSESVLIDWRTVGLFATNSFLIKCCQTGEGVLVDASGDAPVLQEMIESHEVQLKYFLQTHAHLDHVAALEELKSWKPEAPIVLHPDEKMLYDNVPMQCRMFGLPALSSPPPVDRWVEEGEQIDFGRLSVKILKTPGHTEGSITFVLEAGEETFLFSGDTLFAGSVGRIDLPGGDMAVLQSSLQRLMEFPDEASVFPGHMEPTTIGHERRTNPFLQL